MGAGKIRGATFGIPVPRSAPFVSYLLSWYEGKTHVGLKSMASCLEDLIQYISTTLLLPDPTQARSSRHSRCTYVVDIRTGEMYRMTRKIYKKTAKREQLTSYRRCAREGVARGEAGQIRLGSANALRSPDTSHTSR